MITIVPTPIGNLADITLRALEVLKNVSGIICEDSRRTSTLLNHYQIHKPLLILNDFNETKEFPKILNRLIMGENLALVSDAGTPLVSDPGYKLIRACLESGITVDSLPGPSSILPALTLSGLPPDKFLFIGYLPEKISHLNETLEKIKTINSILKLTVIIFISPHKLVKTLENFQNIFGDSTIVLATELTKVHQSVNNKAVSWWLDFFKKYPPKGEYILLFNQLSS